MTGVSVIICCFNSSSRIEETLSYLSNQQTLTDLKWEVVLVDNASTDNTVEVANAIWIKLDRKDIAFTIARQPIPGLANARQAGTDMAKYDIIIFCDDDNRLQEHYIQSAFELMRNPQVAIVCGYGIAVTGHSFPEWFNEVFTFYACHSIATNPTVGRQPDDLQYGAGMVIRKSFMKLVALSGYSYYLNDRSGSKLSSGQDTELILLARIVGWKVIGSGDLKFYHYIPEARLSKSYLYKLIQGVCFNGFKLEPFKIYFQNAKPLTNITWLKDTLYVMKYLLGAVFHYVFKNSFQNKVVLWTNWHALISSLSNYNRYKEIARRLDNVKLNFAERQSNINKILR